MSWLGYVTSLEQGAIKCDYAAIVGPQEGQWRLWAESQDKSTFPATEAEVMVGVNALVTQDGSDICANGLMCGGHKFAVLRLEPDALVLQGKEDGKKGMSLVFLMTDKIMLIGYNSDSAIKTSQLRVVMAKMVDYLRSVGF